MEAHGRVFWDEDDEEELREEPEDSPIEQAYAQGEKREQNAELHVSNVRLRKKVAQAELGLAELELDERVRAQTHKVEENAKLRTMNAKLREKAELLEVDMNATAAKQELKEQGRKVEEFATLKGENVELHRKEQLAELELAAPANASQEQRRVEEHAVADRAAAEKAAEDLRVELARKEREVEEEARGAAQKAETNYELRLENAQLHQQEDALEVQVEQGNEHERLQAEEAAAEAALAPEEAHAAADLKAAEEELDRLKHGSWRVDGAGTLEPQVAVAGEGMALAEGGGLLVVDAAQKVLAEGAAQQLEA